MNKVLVGMTVWIPENLPHRAKSFDYVCRDLTASRSHTDFDLLIIDNTTTHRDALDALFWLKGVLGATLERYDPQLGWMMGRNKMIERFMAGEWERLVMMDCDMRMLRPDWIAKVESLAVTDPHLHFYLMMPENQRDLYQGRIVLPTGTQADVYGTAVGHVMVVDRTCIERIGGFYIHELGEWGFHDNEYGLRAQISGLLSEYDNQFLDPVLTRVFHDDARRFEHDNSAWKQSMIPRYGPVLDKMVAEMKAGLRSTYVDYMTGDYRR